MLTEAKITKIFRITNNFCKVFDAQMGKYTIKTVLDVNITMIPLYPRPK